MTSKDPAGDAFESVQKRVQVLIEANPWLVDEMRDAFLAYLPTVAKYRQLGREWNERHRASNWSNSTLDPQNAPPDPEQLDLKALTSLPYGTDRDTIVLFHLGGIADAGWMSPVVQQPGTPGALPASLELLMLWDARQRTRFAADDEAAAYPQKLTAGAAQHMLAHLEEMVQDRTPANEHAPLSNQVEDAFGKARAFVEHLAMVAQQAREYRPTSDKPDVWQDVAFNFAEAFMAWEDLSHLLTPLVCTEARRVYSPGTPSIRLGVSKEAAPFVPTLPASAVDVLAAYRRVTLGATPYPTVIEAVADELGIYFRNVVYTGRRHPLEPDLDRLSGEAKARATARQVAQGKPAEPMGWRAILNELRARETRAVVRRRLGIVTNWDVLERMMLEWKAQDRERAESALFQLRCDPINFPELRMQLMREAEAVIAAASKLNAQTIDPAMLAQLEAIAAAADPRAIDRAAERGAAKALQASGGAGAKRGGTPKSKSGVLQLLRNATNSDSRVLQLHRDGKSCKQIAQMLTAGGWKISKSTVHRTIQRSGEGVPPGGVPRRGTGEENLSIQERPGNRRISREK
jgi:hypothetical protein